MATYSSLADLKARAPILVIDAESTPTEQQAGIYISQCNEEINSALASQGVSVPVAVPDTFKRDLRQLEATGAAALALLARFPQEAGPGSLAQGPLLWRTYRDRLKEFRKGVGIPVGVSSGTERSPRGFLTDENAVGAEPLAVDAWGQDIQADPLFTIDKKF